VISLASHGVEAAVATSPGLKLGVNVAGGMVTYAPVAEAAGVPYIGVDQALGLGS
jgi:alanine dehydrogenase